jgi:hypothetical protein
VIVVACLLHVWIIGPFLFITQGINQCGDR